MEKIIKILAAPLFVGLIISCGGKVAPTLPPVEVPVAHVVQMDVPVESSYTGQTFGESDIKINPRVNGQVLGIHFKEGTLVTKGQLLYSVDPIPYQNKVDQASGAVSEAKTYLAKTKADLDMIEPLAKINAVSQRELVSAKAQYEASQGKIQSAEAALRNAKIELSYCSIVAPISGLIGITKVRVGDYVSAGPYSELTTISQLTEIRVRFTISEQEFMRLYRQATADESSMKGDSENITLILSDGSIYPSRGKFSFADRQIDPATGAMTIEAKFENPDRILRPGQYVKVSFVTEHRKQALLVPQRAVSEIQGISQIYTLNDSNKVVLKFVKTGPIYQDGYIIEEGITAKERIVLGGSQMLRPGSVVRPKEIQWKPELKEASK